MDDERHLVRAPTVAETLQLRALAGGVLAGADADVATFGAVLSAWLPAPLADVLDAMDPREAFALVSGWADAGMPDPAARRARERDDDEDDDEERAARGADPDRAFLAVLADVCSAFNTDPARCLAMPWPVFLWLVDSNGTAAARAVLRDALAAGIPHAGKGGARVLAKLRRDARPGAAAAEGPGGFADDGHGASAPPEVVARDLAALRAQLGDYGAQANVRAEHTTTPTE